MFTKNQIYLLWFSNCVILTEDGVLYGYGSNMHRCMTKWFQNASSRATIINTKIDNDVLKHVQRMIGRFYSIAMLTHSGDLYIVGKGFSDDFKKVNIRDDNEQEQELLSCKFWRFTFISVDDRW